MRGAPAPQSSNLVGDHTRGHLAYDAPLTSDIASLASPVSNWVRTAKSPDALAHDVAEAIAAAQQPPGQVSTLIIPADVQWGETQKPRTANASDPHTRGGRRRNIERCGHAHPLRPQSRPAPWRRSPGCRRATRGGRNRRGNWSSPDRGKHFPRAGNEAATCPRSSDSRISQNKPARSSPPTTRWSSRAHGRLSHSLVTPTIPANSRPKQALSPSVPPLKTALAPSRGWQRPSGPRPRKLPLRPSPSRTPPTNLSTPQLWGQFSRAACPRTRS